MKMSETYDGTHQPLNPRDRNPPAYTVTMGAAAEPVNLQQPTTAAPPSYAVNIPQQLPQSNVVTNRQPIQYQNQPYPQLPPGRVVVQQANPVPSILVEFSGRTSISLGIAQTVLAGLAILLNGIALGVNASLCFVGHGFWTSIFVIISGSLTVVAGQKKSHKLVSASLGMNIISILAAITGLGFSVTAMIVDFSQWKCDGVNNCIYTTYTAGVTVNALLVVVFLAELICCLFAAILCCSGGGCCPGNRGCCSCCCDQTQQATVMMPHSTTTQPPSALVTTTNERAMLVPRNYNNITNSNNNSNNPSDNNDPITGDPYQLGQLE